MDNTYFSLFENWLKERVSILRMNELLDSLEEISKIFVSSGVIYESVFETTDISVLCSVKDTLDNDPEISSKYMIKKFTMSFALENYIKWAEEYNRAQNADTYSEENDNQSNDYFDNIYYINNDNNNSYSNTRPLYAVYFNIKKIEADTWPELYVKIMSILVKENYSKIMTFNGYGDVYYKSENNSFPTAITPAGIGYNLYVNVNLSVDEIVDKIKKFITICDLDFDDLVIAYTETSGSISSDNSSYSTGKYSYMNDPAAEKDKTDEPEDENSYLTDINTYNEYNDSDSDFDSFDVSDNNSVYDSNEPDDISSDSQYSDFDIFKGFEDELNEMDEYESPDDKSAPASDQLSDKNEMDSEEHILYKTKILNSVKDGGIEVNNRFYTIKRDECSLGDLTFMLSKLVNDAEQHQLSRAGSAMYIQNFEIAQSEFNAAYHNREFLHSLIDELAELRDEMNNSEITSDYKTEKTNNISFEIVDSLLSDLLGGQKTALLEAEKRLGGAEDSEDDVKVYANNISLAETWIMKLSSIRDTIDSIENDISINDSIAVNNCSNYDETAVSFDY